MRMKLAFLLVFAIGFSEFSFADEGMWLPLHIKRLNYTDMQKAGLELTAQEIYDVNNSSLKDAIVVLNGGSCTAEMISKEGLMLTNHHCAYGVIQSSSTVETNYLRDGFWAMKRSDEIPAQGMRASFLIKMEDVTDDALSNVTDDMSEEDRSKAIMSMGDSIKKKALDGLKGHDATFKSMFNGNRYYLFVYKTYRDVRLVAAPPEAIGKYGGDTDNWMWPRHTGDFSMLRIYTDKDGNPAEYAEDNIPLNPKHHLPISLDGVKKDDFAMIMGFPGSTDRYLTSYGVKSEIATTHQARIKLRSVRLDVYKKDMDNDEAIRLKYASKYAGISNYYKNSIGMVKALNRLKVADQKAEKEAQLMKWLDSNPDKKKQYGEALSLIEEALDKGNDYKLARSYVIDALYYSEIVGLAWRFNGLKTLLMAEEQDEEKIAKATKALKARADKFYKDYNKATDKKGFAATLSIYNEDIPNQYKPELFEMANGKFKGDYNKFADYVYSKTIFADQEAMNKFLSDPDLKTLTKDPAFQLAQEARAIYFNLNGSDEQKKYTDNLKRGRRLFLAALMEMEKDKSFYPDANSTLRLTYGNVLDYEPRDAVHYDLYTTLEGAMEKEDPNNREFIIPEKLKSLYEKKDYGQYGQDGMMIVNFITNNDITGGNSGSPVINGKGHLIGCAFDGNWEALSGDIAFEQKMQRTIVCDIRYILFVVTNLRGQGTLLKK